MRCNVCVVFCVTTYSQAPRVSVLPMSTPPEDHPSTPTAPRVSVVPEKSVYPSPADPGHSPPPLPLPSPQAEHTDLQMIRARHSHGQPLPPHQPVPRDPASPEREEQWFPDPGPPKDRGGLENPKPWIYGTTKQPAPTTTSTPQTAPRLERPPPPQPTHTPTGTTTPGADPRTKGTPATTSTPMDPQAAQMPSLQVLWLKMSRFIEA